MHVCAYSNARHLSMDATAPQSVRLSDGNSGRLEVLVDSSWSAVCDGDFDDNAAKVVCRQLGRAVGSPLYYAKSGSYSDVSGECSTSAVSG